MIIHIILLLNGINTPWAESLCGCGIYPFILTYLIAHSLGLCVNTKMMILYNYIVFNCIILQRLNFFGDCITIARWCMLGIGIVLLSLTILRIYGNNTTYSSPDSGDFPQGGR